MLNLKNTLDGYLKTVEVIGNTVQDTNNLANIRSVGDKVGGQELYKIDVVSCGKNLFDKTKVTKNTCPSETTGELFSTALYGCSDFINVKPNTNYKTNSSILRYAFYNQNKKFISGGISTNFNSPSNASFVRVSVRNEEFDAYQLEEGNQVTPYEPYKENKLEILSPVQLEKVGDVADRIICKDGVWGVEKNILNKYIDKSQNISYVTNYGNVYRYDVTDMHDIFVSSSTSQDIICDKYIPVTITTPNVEGIAKHGSVKAIQIQSKISDLQEFKNQLNINIKVKADTPQFIPLPHDQQVKLRTFAGQTNIAFLTEIAGQIKAQVPKSLGATVNTHTEQITELHNSLERVKKLEESTVSTVETGSNFTTVDATSNGYFEDVKLEGKTLVNLWNGTNNGYGNETMYYCKPLTTYTIYFIAGDGEGQINYQYKNISNKTHGDSMLYNSITSTDNIILTTINTKEDSKNICIHAYHYTA